MQPAPLKHIAARAADRQGFHPIGFTSRPSGAKNTPTPIGTPDGTKRLVSSRGVIDRVSFEGDLDGRGVAIGAYRNS